MNRRNRIILDIAAIILLIVSILLPKNGGLRYLADVLRIAGSIGVVLSIYFQIASRKK